MKNSDIWETTPRASIARRLQTFPIRLGARVDPEGSVRSSATRTPPVGGAIAMCADSDFAPSMGMCLQIDRLEMHRHGRHSIRPIGEVRIRGTHHIVDGACLATIDKAQIGDPGAHSVHRSRISAYALSIPEFRPRLGWASIPMLHWTRPMFYPNRAVRVRRPAFAASVPRRSYSVPGRRRASPPRNTTHPVRAGRALWSKGRHHRWACRGAGRDRNIYPDSQTRLQSCAGAKNSGRGQSVHLEYNPTANRVVAPGRH